MDERLRKQNQDKWIGLNLIDPPERYDTDATPLNTIAFASTGGDDVHFSFISDKSQLSDQSRVIITSPYSSDSPLECNIILASNLYDFLCLGYHAGFGPLESLSMYWDETIQVLDGQSDDPDFDEEQLETIKVYRRELQLSPPISVNRKLSTLNKLRDKLLRF